MRFSASRLKLWMECPLAAHYRYDQRLPVRTNGKTRFGVVIHEALALYNETGDLSRAVAQFKENWAREQPDYWPRFTSYGSLRQKGLEILDAVAAHERFQDRTVIGTEIPFLVPFGEHELTGFIDLVDIKRSGTGVELLRVIDYKTASKMPTVEALALDPQLTVYAWAVRQREFWTGVPGDPDHPGIENGEWLWETVGKLMGLRVIWYALWTGKEKDAGPRTDLDFRRLYRVCTEIVKSIDADVHVPRIGSACTICDFVEPCAMHIPLARDQLTEPTEDRWI